MREGWPRRGGARGSGSTIATASAEHVGGGRGNATEEGGSGTWGLRAPGSRLPPRGTQVSPQIFTEPRNEDISSDRRNVPWYPENILIDTVARVQQDLTDIRAESRQLRTPGVLFVVSIFR